MADHRFPCFCSFIALLVGITGAYCVLLLLLLVQQHHYSLVSRYYLREHHFYYIPLSNYQPSSPFSNQSRTCSLWNIISTITKLIAYSLTFMMLHIRNYRTSQHQTMGLSVSRLLFTIIDTIFFLNNNVERIQKFDK